MELENIRRVYLVGIGGIGMSALARYFHKRGCLVSGYDRTSTDLTSALRGEGMQISFEDKPESLMLDFDKADPSVLIIYTPAIPADSKILSYFRTKGFSLLKRSEVLGVISRGMFTIAVAGTHGKTTTSTLVAHILKHSGHDCTAFLGGISSNYNTNVLFGANETVVVEADEYDRSFLRLHPDIAVITSIDPDHLDIYGSSDSVTESFRLFAGQLKTGGRLICREGLPVQGDISYSASTQASAQAKNVRVEGGAFVFDFYDGRYTIEAIRMQLPGLHNVENAVAAIEVALLLSVAPDKIKSAVEAFAGVKRRFEYIVKNSSIVYIDDYAHHPEELRACITAARSLYPDRKLTMVFQPHLYSRTRDFAEEFAAVLSMVDELILLDIYPARELPIPGVNSEMILEKAEVKVKRLCTKRGLPDCLNERHPELLITAGAGDIDTLVGPLKELYGNA